MHRPPRRDPEPVGGTFAATALPASLRRLTLDLQGVGPDVRCADGVLEAAHRRLSMVENLHARSCHPSVSEEQQQTDTLLGRCRYKSDDEPCKLQLARLRKLTEVTLRGEESWRVMRELLMLPDAAPLPASLRVLRHETADLLDLSADGRTQGLAAVIIPVLHLLADVVVCTYVETDPTEDSAASAPAEAPDLPAGFRALWLRTSCIAVSVNSVQDDGSPVTSVDAAEELCYFRAKVLLRVPAVRWWRDHCATDPG